MVRKPIVLAKLTRPGALGLIFRERLFAWLDHARQRPVAWISGPGGIGKTSLVSSYLDARNIPAVWYQVDAGDADAATFFHYLGLAVKTTTRVKSSHQFRPEFFPKWEEFTRRYFQHLFNRLPTPFIIVLDNYQEVAREAILHRIVGIALDQVPPGINVFIVSRQEPPAPLARWYANSTMAVLDGEALRLTDDESAALAHKWGCDDPAERCAMIESTQGWAAGMVLVLRARSHGINLLSRRDEPPASVFDYFAGEVFAKTAKETQDFLLKTAMLPSMTAAMAGQLTASRNAAWILSELQRTHFFINKRPPREAVFEYHPLFRSFLLARAQERFSPRQLVHLKRKAALLLEQVGQIEAAAEQLGEIEDWQALIRLICQHAEVLLSQGRNQVLQGWIGRIPDRLFQRTPCLLYWQGISLLLVRPLHSREGLQEAQRLYKAQGDAIGALLACVGLMDTYYYAWGNLAGVDPWIDELEQLLMACPDLPSAEIEARVISSGWCLLFRRPLHPLLKAWAQRATYLMQTTSDAQQRLTLAKFVLFYHLWHGDIVRVGLIMEELRPTLSAVEFPPVPLIHWRLIETIYHWCVAAHDAAVKSLEQALEIGRSTGVHILDSAVYAQGVYLSLSAGDATMAATYLEKMQSLIHPTRPLDLAHYQFLKSGTALLKGELQSALTYAQASVDAVKGLGRPFATAAFRLGLAQVFIAQGAHRKARAHLAHARQFAQGMKSRILEYQSLLMEAYSMLETGAVDTALTALRQGLRIGREQGYVNCHPWWSPKLMARLCAQALETGIEVEYVRALIEKRGLRPETQEIEDWPWPLKVYTLGQFVIVKQGDTLRFGKKPQSRPLEMLKALIALGGQDVNVNVLIAALWPDSEGDASRNVFEITLHRLRKLLGDDQAVTLGEGKISVNAQMCWLDLWAFERVEAQARTILHHQTNAAAAASLEPLTETLLKLYRGHFLISEEERAWLLGQRERLRSKFFRYIAETGTILERARQWEKAWTLYHRALDLDPLAEDIYRRLMSCLERCGRYPEAWDVYRRCTLMLSVVLGRKPSAGTDALGRLLKQHLA